MCTSMKWVKTPHINHPVLVPCGHCSACQQQKANARTRRIRDNIGKGDLSLFVTLTYTNDFIPYVKRSDLAKMDEFFTSTSNSYDSLGNSFYYLPVYRNKTGRYVRKGSGYDVQFVSKENKEPITTLQVSRNDWQKGYGSINDITNMPQCISVIIYKDLQNFFKRLHISLSRKFHYVGKFSSFQCSEYGPRTYRAHFHLLLTIRPENEALFRAAILQAWPFADSRRTAKFIEVARDAASYVSSYVNRGSDFPAFLSDSQICPKHSYSRGFGLANDHFSLSSIQEKIRKRDMSYPVLSVVNGELLERNLLVPKYAINRFFPKFKGYSKLSLSSLYDILQNPKRIVKYCRLLDLNQKELHQIKVSLNNAYCRFLNNYDFGRNVSEVPEPVARNTFAVMFVDSWKVRQSTLMKKWYENENHDAPLLMYDNWAEYRVHDVSFLNRRFVEHLISLNPELEKYENPNTFPRNVSVTDAYTDLFNKKLKSRKVANISMSACGYDV